MDAKDKVRFLNQPDCRKLKELYVKYRNDGELVGNIKPSVLRLMDLLVDEHEKRDLEMRDLKGKRPVVIDEHSSDEIHDWGPMGIVACSKGPDGQYVRFNPIIHFFIQELFDMYVNIADWQSDALPAKILRHSVSEREILRYILHEMGFYNLDDVD